LSQATYLANIYVILKVKRELRRDVCSAMQVLEVSGPRSGNRSTVTGGARAYIEVLAAHLDEAI